MVLLVIAFILIIALIAIKISDRLGIPSLLLFLLLGVSFNFMGVEFDNFEVADQFASLALLFIIFYGGFGTNWTMSKPVAKEAITLSSLGVVATALLTGFFAYLFLGFNLIEAMLLGSIVGSTDYASVASILKSRNLNLKYNTASLLELESGSNDPTAFTMVTVFLTIMLGQSVSIPLMIIQQVGFGIAMGFLLGFILIKLLEYIQFGEGYVTIFIVAFTLITYALTNQIGGNGYLAAYIFGIYIGNQEFIGKREVIFFNDGLTNVMQIGLFFVLGLLSNPRSIIEMLPISIVIMLFMTLIARPVSVYGLMWPFKLKGKQMAVISVAGLRGAAAIAFAIVVVNAQPPLTEDIFHIVFDICLLSSLIQGTLLPIVSKKLHMLDPSDTVLRTFNQYQDKSEIGFFKTTIDENSDLVGTFVNELNLEFDFIVAKIIRDNQTIIPRGHVRLQEDDTVILCGEQYFDESGEDLVEFTIGPFHSWLDKTIQSLNLPKDSIIVVIQRADGTILIPQGATTIQLNDTVVAIDGQKKMMRRGIS